MLLTAGAAAHADTSIGTNTVSTAVEAVTTTITPATSGTSDPITITSDAVQSAVAGVDAVDDQLARNAATTVDDPVGTLTEAVDDTVRTVRVVADDAATESLASARPGDEERAATLPQPIRPRLLTARERAGEPLDAPRGATAALFSERSALLSATAGDTASNALPPNDSPATPPVTPFPTGHSVPSWPLDPAATGFIFTLTGVILLRTIGSPPPGWLRHVFATTPFRGAAVALAVERPG
jgi:hypothetical protein